MSNCPLCYHNNNELGPIPIIQLDTEIYIAYNLSIIKIRGVYNNNTSYNTSGLFIISTNYSQAIITSCNIYYNNKHFTSSVIDPSIVNIENNKSKEYNDDIPFDSLLFKMPFNDCPPYCNITVDVTYIQKLSFNSNGSFQLIVPLKIPPENILPNSNQNFSTIKCVLDSGTPVCQWDCQTHQLHLMEHTSPFVYPTNPYSPPGTTAVALQSNFIPLYQTTDFVLNYLGLSSNIITGSSLVELPYHPNTIVCI